MNSVIVVGAGASGLMAAITAAREGALVTVLEAMEKPARKLLMTGNGRCNLTSLDFSRKDCYRGSDPSFWQKVYAQFDEKQTMAFFEEMGLLLQKRGGGVYPLTDQASSVVDRLLLEVQKLPVKLKCQEKVVRMERSGDRWQVFTETWHYETDAVILACGSCAVPVTGSDGSGYELAKLAGHTIVRPLPALVPLKCREGFVKKLAGLRTRADLTMYITDKDGHGKAVYTESGELQWTEYGISGIVVFQLSRYAACALPQGSKVQVQIDCLPSVKEETLLEMLKKKMPEESIADALTGMIPKKMIAVILELCRIKRASSRPDAETLQEVCHTIKQLSVTVTGTRSFEQAQACAGGVSTGEVNPKTMESKICHGLYLTGELLDVDGICGGYNLQWAWSTGYVAGIHSAGKGEQHA